MRPASGTISPIIKRSRVDFPQPLGPIRTVVRPGSIARLRPVRAAVESKRLVTS